jgi:paraquat-inducible protein B
VGQVVTYTLNPEGKGVDIEVFIHAPNDAFVTENTALLNASGIDINVGANGFAVKTESLSTMLVGGIAFRAPDYSPNDVAASEDKDFELFADQQTAPPNGKAQYMVLRFEQSLRGLKVDAPVEFLGMEIGRVVGINLDFDAKKRTFPLNVGIVIYPQRLGQAYKKMLTESSTIPTTKRRYSSARHLRRQRSARSGPQRQPADRAAVYRAGFLPESRESCIRRNGPTGRLAHRARQPRTIAGKTRSGGRQAQQTAGRADCRQPRQQPRRAAQRPATVQCEKPCRAQTTLADVSKTCSPPVRPWPRIHRSARNSPRPSTNSGACRVRCVSCRTISVAHPESLIRGRLDNAAPLDLKGPPRN